MVAVTVAVHSSSTSSFVEAKNYGVGGGEKSTFGFGVKDFEDLVQFGENVYFDDNIAILCG